MEKRECDIQKLLVEMNKYLEDRGGKCNQYCFDLNNENNIIIKKLKLDYPYFKNLVDICYKRGFIDRKYYQAIDHYQFSYSLTRKGEELALEVKQNKLLYILQKNNYKIIIAIIGAALRAFFSKLFK